MTEEDVTLRLKFTQAIYVSSNQQPDKLRVTFRDPFMFISEKNKPLKTKKNYGRRGLQGVSDVLDFITIERDLPP